MGEEIAFENGRYFDFQGLGTLTLDRVILHHSSTSTYIPNFIEIEETFCGRADGHLRPTLLGLLGGVDLKIVIHDCGVCIYLEITKIVSLGVIHSTTVLIGVKLGMESTFSQLFMPCFIPSVQPDASAGENLSNINTGICH